MQALEKLLKNHKGRFQIGVDLDGVIIDHDRTFSRVLGALGWRMRPWQLNSNVLGNFLPGEVYSVVKHIVYSHLRGGASWMKEAKRTIEALGEHIVIVSVQKEPEAERKLWVWLKKQNFFNYVPKYRIHVVRSREKKLKLIAKLKPLIFIDDGLDVLRHLPRGVAPLLFDPHFVSRRIALSKKIPVVRDWREIRRLLRSRS